MVPTHRTGRMAQALIRWTRRSASDTSYAGSPAESRLRNQVAETDVLLLQCDATGCWNALAALQGVGATPVSHAVNPATRRGDARVTRGSAKAWQPA